jgi:hypothetical protein
VLFRWDENELVQCGKWPSLLSIRASVWESWVASVGAVLVDSATGGGVSEG